MFKKRILVALLVACLTITSCFGFAPQAFAQTQTNAGDQHTTEQDQTGGTDTTDQEQQPGDEGEESDQEPAPEPDPTPEPELNPEPAPEPDPVRNGWYNGKYYKNDKLYTGWAGSTYVKNGKLYTGWAGGKYVKSGKLYTGIRMSGSVPYYYTKGVKNTKVSYAYNNKRYKNGKLFTGVAKLSSGIPYYYVKGVKNKTSTYTYNGKRYLNGKLYTGIRKIDKKVYYFSKGVKSKTKIYTYKSKKYKNGKLYSGLYKSYYYSSGKKVTSQKSKVKKMKTGQIHYFKKDGSAYTGTGWKRIKGKRYYFKKGIACTGWNYIGDYKYYFHKKTGTLCQDLIGCQGSKWKKKDLMIKVNRQKNCVTIYAKDGKKGYIIPVKAMTCSVGKKETPTIRGTYTLKDKSGRIFRWHKLGGPDMGGYVYGQYAVRIHSGFMFHSVTYREPNNRAFIASTYNNLGRPASHGCVRLQVKDAKLIYEIVKYRNTKVKIYDSDYTGPFDKPVLKKIPAGQKYEPTDPSI